MGKSVLTVSGSSQKDSSNTRLLKAIAELSSKMTLSHCDILHTLPMYSVELDHNPLPKEVTEWRKSVQDADAVIISTPEYIHNIPAILKNALEWLTTSGELSEKTVLALTYTPHPPRGEKAMQSLLWSLEALNARVGAQLPLYQNECHIDATGQITNREVVEMLREALNLL